jgi:hypothetical protein
MAVPAEAEAQAIVVNWLPLELPARAQDILPVLSESGWRFHRV